MIMVAKAMMVSPEGRLVGLTMSILIDAVYREDLNKWNEILNRICRLRLYTLYMQGKSVGSILINEHQDLWNAWTCMTKVCCRAETPIIA